MIALLLAAALVLPADPDPTTGVANPAVTDATVDQTVCNKAKDDKGHDWIFNQRPPTSYTDKLKREQLPPGTDLHLFEEDHVWAISDGGSPTDPHNLRPQAWAGPGGAKVKDHEVEDVVHRELCKHSITLEQGHAVISAWIVAHHPYPIVQTGAPQ